MRKYCQSIDLNEAGSRSMSTEDEVSRGRDSIKHK